MRGGWRGLEEMSRFFSSPLLNLIPRMQLAFEPVVLLHSRCVQSSIHLRVIQSSATWRIDARSVVDARATRSTVEGGGGLISSNRLHTRRIRCCCLSLTDLDLNRCRITSISRTESRRPPHSPPPLPSLPSHSLPVFVSLRTSSSNRRPIPPNPHPRDYA